MLIGTILTLIFLLIILIKSKNIFHKFFVGFIGILVFIYIITTFLPILVATIRYSISGEIMSSISITAAGIQGKGYYIGSLGVISNSFSIPNDLWSIVFGGELIRHAHSDSGILKVLFSMGIFGLLAHLFFYYKLIVIYLKNSVTLEFWGMLVPIMTIVFIFDLKDNNIFTKNITEVLIILALLLLINNKNENRNSTSFK